MVWTTRPGKDGKYEVRTGSEIKFETDKDTALRTVICLNLLNDYSLKELETAAFRLFSIKRFGQSVTHFIQDLFQ